MTDVLPFPTSNSRRRNIAFRCPGEPRSLDDSAIRFGTVVTTVQAIPRALASLDSVLSGSDLHVLANLLEETSRKVRVLAACADEVDGGGR